MEDEERRTGNKEFEIINKNREGENRGQDKLELEKRFTSTLTLIFFIAWPLGHFPSSFYITHLVTIYF